MDIRKLQRAIVDGLEDVKAQNIRVFNTEHLSPLFERVIVASGTSNRQTKALASSVRDSVRAAGFPVLRMEGEDNGEWIIVDCGAAVAHIMQPAIRDYYHLEEIWGEKPVRLKTAAVAGLPKASGDGAADAKSAASPKKRASSPAKKTAAPAKKNAAPAKKSAVPAKKSAAPAKKTTEPAKKTAAPAKRSAAPAKKSAAPAKKAATSTGKSAAAAAKRTTRSGAAGTRRGSAGGARD